MQFRPGSSHIATVELTNPTAANWDYVGELYLGDRAATSGSVAFSLAAGETKLVSFPVVMPSVGGVYPVYLDISCRGTLLAHFLSEEAITIAGAEVANYSVNIGVSKSMPKVGETVEWWAYVTNISSVSGKPTASWFLEGQLLETIEYPSIVAPGSTVLMHGPSFQPDTSGIHTLAVQVDGATDEAQIVAEAAPAEFQVTGLTISPSEVYVGEPVSAAVTVTNVGGSQGTYSVTCEVSPSTVTIAEVLPAVAPLTDLMSGLVTFVVLAMMGSYMLKAVK